MTLNMDLDLLGEPTALALLYETIATMKGKGDRLDVVLRGTSRTFDKAWHGRLRYKLLQADLPDRLIRLLSDYLTDRKANIRIDDYIGPTFSVSVGVP